MLQVKAIKLEHVKPCFGKVSLLEPSLPLKRFLLLVLIWVFVELVCSNDSLVISQRQEQYIYIYSMLCEATLFCEDGMTAEPVSETLVNLPRVLRFK